MKYITNVLPLLISLVFAHILLYFTYIDKDVFWYMYTAAILFLITFALFQQLPKNESSRREVYLYGILSGVFLYVTFKVGYVVLAIFLPSIQKDVNKLYDLYSPEFIWHYLVLFLIFIPGEEIFWRGFFQQKLANKMNASVAILLSSLAYASIFYYSPQPIWMLAALVAGLFWGILYQWKQSLKLVIISHLVFDLLFIILLPL
ncbi:CPBP family intramembrane glutamic endopeptidase [Bacillus sp. 2205SS5-2]|uniref:CPBP family intramembrane glutamic endopeptidase n=1 Tax=Bacillus sp. 2205SS5-2 TaxID=3109031 RepID=UPI003004AF59